MWTNQMPDYAAAPFYPIICVSASEAVDEEHRQDYTYLQGGGDDEETWANGLTAPLFWCVALLGPHPPCARVLQKHPASSPARPPAPRLLLPHPRLCPLHLAAMCCVSFCRQGPRRRAACRGPRALRVPSRGGCAQCQGRGEAEAEQRAAGAGTPAVERVCRRGLSRGCARRWGGRRRRRPGRGRVSSSRARVVAGLTHCLPTRACLCWCARPPLPPPAHAQPD